MTSHREAPRISKDPAADNTDLYAFVSPDSSDKVTMIANYIPLEEPAGGPNFHLFDEDVLYEINIDNNGDGIEELIYQFRFKTTTLDPKTFLYNKGTISFDGQSYTNLNVQQTYTVTRIAGGTPTLLGTGLLTAPANIGPESTPTYEADLVPPAIQQLSNNEGTVFAGPRAEGFYVDLGSIFDLLLLRPFEGAYNPALPKPTPTPHTTPSGGVDDTSGFNVHSIALQVPINRLTMNGSTPTDPFDPAAIIGIYASASRQKATILNGPLLGSTPTLAGPFTQVSRLGVPLINEVLIPLGMKDFWNSSEPKDDSQFAQFYNDPEPSRLIPKLYPGVTVPSAPRGDIVAALLTGFSLKPLGLPFTNATAVQADLLRLNVAVPPTQTSPNRLGILARDLLGNPSPDLAGFPNGRRVFDDVIDIEVQALAGATPFTPSFNKPPNSLLGDGVDTTDKPYLTKFPYLATPHQGFLHVHTHD